MPRIGSAPALLVLLALATSLPAQYDGATAVPQRMRPGFRTIVEEDARKWLTFLASDELQGRMTGTPGYQEAADFVAARFEEFGLEPIGDDGTYFQHVPFPSQRVLDAESFVKAGGLRLASGKDVSFTPAETDVEGDVVFVRANGPEATLDNARVMRSKVVVVAGWDPLNRDLFRQMIVARPKAILEVVSEVGPSDWRVGRFRRRGRTVRGEITAGAANRLAKALRVEGARSKPGEGEAVAQATEGRVRIVVKREEGDAGVPNVVGMLEGSDPDLKDEVVVMGSHLDHIGMRGSQINNGADDDGSGSTALLCVARAFARNPVKPRRSLVFLAFCGEELGLVGSRYYASNPIIPLDRTVAELQMDMIGRNEEFAPRGNREGESPEDNVDTLHLIGSKRLSMELHEIVLAMNEHLKFRFEYDEEDVYTRSDHYSFASKGVPIAFFFSGFHPDYHRPTDTVDKINFTKLTNVAKLVYLVGFTVADQERRLKVDRGPFATK